MLTGSVRREILISESDVNSLAFSPDGQTLAVGTAFHLGSGHLPPLPASRQEGSPDDFDTLAAVSGTRLHLRWKAADHRPGRHLDSDLGCASEPIAQGRYLVSRMCVDVPLKMIPTDARCTANLIGGKKVGRFRMPGRCRSQSSTGVSP
jgi:hypothetical protein